MKFLSSSRNLLLLALCATVLVPVACAQQNIPPAPAQGAGAIAGPVFPKPDPKDFTATTPTVDQVNAFLKATWGYDSSRLFQVQRIARTQIDGVANVVVIVGTRDKPQLSALQFFTMPDGKHIIAGGEILPFGARPYDENRATLLSRPWKSWPPIFPTRTSSSRTSR